MGRVLAARRVLAYYAVSTVSVAPPVFLSVPATTPAAVADQMAGNRLRELAEALLPELDRPLFIAAGQFSDTRDTAGEGALLCPLTLKDRPTGDPRVGVLAVYGQQQLLSDLSQALEILAGQAALAVERVTLAQEVVRQRGQALFRTLVRNTSDAILIVGDDGRIRYATPSAAAIFGDVPVDGSRPADLVNPGTRADAVRVMDMILAGITDGAHGFLLRIVAAFADPFPLTDAEVRATATVGVATSADSADADELLRRGGLALYAAKTAGKRRWRRYQSALSAGMLRRREVQAALEDAVNNAEFTLVYQPMAKLDSGKICGFEALIRWPRPQWGMMLPGQFISLAEETGHIVPLGAWMVRQALSDMVQWRRRIEAPDDSWPHMSVNVSARQFRDPGFVAGVRAALRESGLPPSSLLLELTESVLFVDSDRIGAELDELKQIGVNLAIDDFGTGYSSLSYLLKLPIDVLKIDKSFVTGIAASWRQHALVKGIVRLAGTLEVEVIAEGIETETERELLAAMGCQYGQGYLLSVPVEAAQAEELLSRGLGLAPGYPGSGRRPPGRSSLTGLWLPRRRARRRPLPPAAGSTTGS